LTGLVKKIDQRLNQVTAKTPRAPGAYIIVDSKTDGLDKQLREMAETASLSKVSLCIGAPPTDYQITNDADLTVVIYNFARRGDQKVTANFAIRQGELNDEKVDAIVKALSEVLPK
jgi:hypothetical protein